MLGAADLLLPARLSAIGTFINQTKGLDTACVPTTAQMNAFWSGTPYYHWYIYVGGANRACKTNTNLTAQWVTTNGPASSKWGLMPIWVGLQAPCTPAGRYSVFSYNTTTANSQGRSEAQAAYAALMSLGFLADVPIVLDLEAWDTTKASCVAAAKSFVQGWVDWLHHPSAQSAGVYGSTCGSGLNLFASLARPPDWIWGAAWNGNPSTANMPCVAVGYWTNHQRHKQYRGDHSERWNGITLIVDSDCANGPMYTHHDNLVDPACR